MLEYSLYRILHKGMPTWNPNAKSRAFSYYVRAITNNCFRYLKQRAHKLKRDKEWAELKVTYNLHI